MSNETRTFVIITLGHDEKPDGLMIEGVDWSEFCRWIPDTEKYLKTRRGIKRVDRILMVISWVLRLLAMASIGAATVYWDRFTLFTVILVLIGCEVILNVFVRNTYHDSVYEGIPREKINDTRVESYAQFMADVRAWNERVPLLNLMPNLVAHGQMTPEQMTTVRAGARREYELLMQVRLPLAVSQWLTGGEWGTCTRPIEQMSLKAFEVYLPSEDKSKTVGQVSLPNRHKEDFL